MATDDHRISNGYPMASKGYQVPSDGYLMATAWIPIAIDGYRRPPLDIDGYQMANQWPPNGYRGRPNDY